MGNNTMHIVQKALGTRVLGRVNIRRAVSGYSKFSGEYLSEGKLPIMSISKKSTRKTPVMGGGELPMIEDRASG